MEKEQVLDISWGSIVKVLIAIAIFYLIYLGKEIALWLFFASAISVLLEPAINFLRKIYIPKFLAVILVYLSIFGALGVLVYLSAPIFSEELKQFTYYLPSYFEQISPILKQFGINAAQNFNDFSRIFTDKLQQGSQGVINALMFFFGGVASTVSILTFAFFLSLEEKAMENFLLLLLPQKHEDRIKVIFERAQKKVAGWFGARLLACLFVGAASYIVFYIFGIKYALFLALICGFLNFIPYVGPWVASVILAIFIAVSSGSWMTVIYVLASVVVIQEVENKLLTPLLMKKLTDIPPVLVLFSLFLGGKIFGFLGMVFSVPVFGIVYEFMKEFLQKRKEDEFESV